MQKRINSCIALDFQLVHTLEPFFIMWWIHLTSSMVQLPNGPALSHAQKYLQTSLSFLLHASKLSCRSLLSVLKTQSSQKKTKTLAALSLNLDFVGEFRLFLLPIQIGQSSFLVRPVLLKHCLSTFLGNKKQVTISFQLTFFAVKEFCYFWLMLSQIRYYFHFFIPPTPTS